MTEPEQSPTTEVTERRRHGMAEWEFIALMSLTSATIAVQIDTLLPAFDEMREAFAMAPGDNQISRTITALLIGLAVGQLMWGPFADRFGRKPTLYASLAVVMIGSLGATLSPSFGFLLITRMVIGFGVAGPRIVTLAITRDSYTGDQMARITALVTAVFLIVPILAPLLGEVLVQLFGWRSTHAVGGLLAVVVALWLGRCSETLRTQDQRELRVGPILAASRQALSSRTFVLFSVAQVFTYGAFFPWLGSSELMIGTIYERPGQFAMLFGLNALVMGLAIAAAARMVDRIGSRAIVVAAVSLQFAFAVAAFVVSTQTNGVPPFVVFFVFATILVTLNAVASPLLAAGAMTPVGSIAGTAASVSGFLVFSVGGVLAAVIDARMSDAVTPFFAGFVVYGLAVVVAAVFAFGSVESDSGHARSPAGASV